MSCSNCMKPLGESSRFCDACGTPVADPVLPADKSLAATPIRQGELFEGKWRVQSKLGQGGMGTVFLAEDVILERKVAIKILAAELCGDAEFSARFEREAKLTANLEHPNVVLVYAVGKHNRRPFIVMKYLEGLTLSRYLRQNPRGIAPDKLLPMFSQLCAGLGFIHSRGFVHRDIKAGNIIVGSDGRATILDLGILREVTSKEGLTRAGMLMGTPHYVSPEQALGQAVDHRADLYALGVLLYECLSGALPFTADTEYALLAKHVKSPPPDVCSVVPGLPKSVGEIVRRALAKKPDERFQTAEELYRALEQAFAEAGAIPAPTHPAQPPPASVEAGKGNPAPPIRRTSTTPSAPVAARTPALRRTPTTSDVPAPPGTPVPRRTPTTSDAPVPKGIPVPRRSPTTSDLAVPPGIPVPRRSSTASDLAMPPGIPVPRRTPTTSDVVVPSTTPVARRAPTTANAASMSQTVSMRRAPALDAVQPSTTSEDPRRSTRAGPPPPPAEDGASSATFDESSRPRGRSSIPVRLGIALLVLGGVGFAGHWLLRQSEGPRPEPSGVARPIVPQDVESPRPPEARVVEPPSEAGAAVVAADLGAMAPSTPLPEDSEAATETGLSPDSTPPSATAEVDERTADSRVPAPPETASAAPSGKPADGAATPAVAASAQPAPAELVNSTESEAPDPKSGEPGPSSAATPGAAPATSPAPEEPVEQAPTGVLQLVTYHSGKSFWAHVSVDGVDHGETPNSFRMPAGSHELLIERKGFKPAIHVVEIPANGVVPLRIELVPE